MLANNNKDNAHISVHDLSVLLAAELSNISNELGCKVVLKPMDNFKTVSDNTTMFLISSTTGIPKAVLGCSRPVNQDLIKRGVDASDKIRSMLGERLGAAIIKPISSGYVDGRSYVILPWYRKISTWRPRQLLQRRLLRRPLLGWLCEATAIAAAKGKSDTAGQEFKARLQHLANQNFIDAEVGSAIERAVARIDTGQWRPLHTFDHNDFWLGNVMLTARTGHKSKHLYPFVLIDWAGANPQGYGLYDLIRLALALGLSPAALRRELFAYCKALQCDPVDAQGHLLATLGRLHQHLEYFPEEKFIATFRACWGTLIRAVPSVR